MAVVHREGGATGGMEGQMVVGQRREGNPGGGASKGGALREEGAGGAPGAGDSSSAGGSIRHPGKDFQDAFIYFQK